MIVTFPGARTTNALSEAPAPVAVTAMNRWTVPSVGADGATVSGVNVTLASAVRDGSALSDALIVIDRSAETSAGARYPPLSSIDPTVAGSSGITLQVTATEAPA